MVVENGGRFLNVLDCCQNPQSVRTSRLSIRNVTGIDSENRYSFTTKNENGNTNPAVNCQKQPFLSKTLRILSSEIIEKK